MFRYYDTNYDGTTGALPEPINISAVRLVKITLVIDKDPSALPSPPHAHHPNFNEKPQRQFMSPVRKFVKITSLSKIGGLFCHVFQKITFGEFSNGMNPVRKN